MRHANKFFFNSKHFVPLNCWFGFASFFMFPLRLSSFICEDDLHFWLCKSNLDIGFLASQPFFFLTKSQLTRRQFALNSTFRWFGISICDRKTTKKNNTKHVWLNVWASFASKSITFSSKKKKKSHHKNQFNWLWKTKSQYMENWIAWGNGNLFPPPPPKFSPVQTVGGWSSSSNFTPLSGRKFSRILYFSRVNICDFAMFEKKNSRVEILYLKSSFHHHSYVANKYENSSAKSVWWTREGNWNEENNFSSS